MAKRYTLEEAIERFGTSRVVEYVDKTFEFYWLDFDTGEMVLKADTCDFIVDSSEDTNEDDFKDDLDCGAYCSDFNH